MDGPDLTALSTLDDEQLAAAYVLLGEDAHHITLAAERVKARQQMRALGHDVDGPVDDAKHQAWNDETDRRLAAAVERAPAKAVELAEARKQRLARIARLIVEVPGAVTVDGKPGIIPEQLAGRAAELLEDLDDLEDDTAVYATLEPFIRAHSVA